MPFVVPFICVAVGALVTGVTVCVANAMTNKKGEEED